MSEQIKRAYDLLKKGREIIGNPKNFVKGSFYITSRFPRTANDKVNFEDGDKVCSLGAIAAAGSLCSNDNYRDNCAVKLLAQAMDRYGGESAKRNPAQTVVQFNDSPNTTHKDILTAWDNAIKLAKQALEQTTGANQ